VNLDLRRPPRPLKSSKPPTCIGATVPLLLRHKPKAVQTRRVKRQTASQIPSLCGSLQRCLKPGRLQAPKSQHPGVHPSDSRAHRSTLPGPKLPKTNSGELAGLTGDFKIVIANGKHSYEFTYALP
jgi:hypothetical protein